ncbi:MAG: hypothetical protein KGZ87_09960 [Bacteroidetes bacterium]|nr:hypothetical protein [Bacteroidota bacterium]
MNQVKITIIIFLISLSVIAQRSTNSPYSFFGIGDNTQQYSVEELTSGGIGLTTSDTYHLSFANPANLANLKFTTYALAGTANFLTAKDGTTSEKGTATSASYFSLGFPIGKKAGFSFGLQPRSSVGYEMYIENKDSNDEVTDITLLKGTGGTNRVFAGFGYNIAKNLNVGIEADYSFGNIDNQNVKQLKDVQLATKYQNVSTLNGFGLKVGTNYNTKLTDKIQLYTGVTLAFENKLNTTSREYIYSLSYNNAQEIPRDTIFVSEKESSVIKPMRTSLGIGVGKNDKWYAGLEYSFQDALVFNDGILSSSKAQYQNSSKLSVGGYYTPNINSISSYWERVTYRGGLKFEQTGLAINGIPSTNQFTSIDDFGITFGVGLPIGNQLSNFNLGLELGKRGTTGSGLIQENYINLRLSLSLNDKWFNKIKIN